VSQYLSRVFELFFLPPGLFILLLLISVLFIKKTDRLKGFLVVQILLIYCLSIPITVHFLFQTLEKTPVLTEQQIKNNKKDAIVILAGGMTSYKTEYDGPDINDFTQRRLRYGAWLQKQTGLPIIVTGGVERGGITEAELMARVLKNEYAVQSKIFIEKQSRNTFENAFYSNKIIEKQEFKKIYLVTSAFHMPRALLVFSNQNVVITPAPMSYYHNTMDFIWEDFWPNSNAMWANYLALHEIIGRLWYQIRYQLRN